MKGSLITLEGISGIGKTYYFNKLKGIYTDNNFVFNVEIFNEEHRGINSKIFNILTNTGSRFFDLDNPKMETLLIAAKQANDENSFVIPNLNLGNIVISDRGYDTICIVEGIMLSLKYNRDIRECIDELYNTIKYFNIVPTKTILLTGNVDKSIERAERRDKEKYSLKELKILRNSAKYYKEYQKKYSDRIELVNVDDCEEKIINKLKLIIDNIK